MLWLSSIQTLHFQSFLLFSFLCLAKHSRNAGRNVAVNRRCVPVFFVQDNAFLFLISHRTNRLLESQPPLHTHIYQLQTMTRIATTMGSSSSDQEYDRAKEVKQFDDSKGGVKALVDSGLTSIPRIFIHPQETLSDIKSIPCNQHDAIVIPTIDLAGQRSATVDQIARACREFGFFQVVNHGIPQEVLEGTIAGIRRFHEQPMEVKAKLYGREMKPVSFFCNVDLFHSKAASWRDTIQIQLGGPTKASPEQIPELCRNELAEWNLQTKRVAELLMELMCEGLGVDAGKMKELTCSEGRTLVGHYYAPCPQPDLTVGIASHTDPGVLTLLLQDQIGGLQVKYDDGWLDVEPVPGALVVNVGDVLQIMSNDEYRSVEHRVLANRSKEPRISIAIFFNPGNREGTYGPFPEIISAEKPALYREFVFTDFIRRFFKKELDGKTLSNCYKL